MAAARRPPWFRKKAPEQNMLITVYLTTLIIGGSLLGLSIFGGGDHEADHDLDSAGGGLLEADVDMAADADFDADADMDVADALDSSGDSAGGGFDVHGLDAWLPIGSLRFWTFFFAFFGLVGTALTLVSGLGSTLVLASSVGVGYVSGVGATKVMRSLTRLPVGTVRGAQDLIGSSGTLLLPVAPGQPGKVRMQIGDRSIEEIAVSEDAFETGAQVLVIGTDEEGNLIVSHPALLSS